MAKTKIAIITRTRDRSLLLERALKSVAMQSYQEYIHVIVNDGGDKKAVEEAVKKYGNANATHFVHNEKAVGHTKALNQGIEAVDSEYITILDDDDSWPERRLEKTVQYLDETKEKAVVVKMDVVIEEIVDGEIKKLSQHLHPESGEGEISLFKQCYKNYISNGIVTYRRDLYNELGGYDETLEVGEDWDFGIKMLLKCDVGFLRDEEPLFFYHQRPKQKGSDGNSVHVNVRQQERTINIIRNRYLRQDIENRHLGVGYIMNRLAYDESLVVRLEGHMNHVGDNIKDTTIGQLTANARSIIREESFISKVKTKLRGGNGE